MKITAVRIHAAGDPEVLKLEELELPSPATGEVRIRHTAIGLNFQDIYTRSGQYPAPMPSGLGTEAVGIVEAVGEGVSGFKVGDRVCYASGPVLGACATHRNYPAARLLHAPAHMDDATIAASLLKGMTVEYLLQRCYPVQRGQIVLMHAAAGGVGLLAGQWGKALGARMIGVAAGPEKVALALANGYEFCIDRLGEDIPARVKEITGGVGVPVVYDSVGKNSFDASLNSLAPRGYFVSFGTTTGAPPPVPASTLQKMGSLYFTRPTLVTYTASTEDLRASAAAVFAMFERGAVRVSVNQRYTMKDIARAHADLESGRTTGSSVILP
ncbi:quinone oxidoreductase family protein [Variovorax saccharolyticus]|uniref:quinone oxidoreductase family protein n=1 Tax=Variovorax saccharolyticus TaxID=3053516 RepID=UPI0025781153|nr:quinone oxidoreductase [Variovorax sp. J22R187]MDM0018975.1 quinone oxidoreductase [Variovorax sp. J22R187]